MLQQSASHSKPGMHLPCLQCSVLLSFLWFLLLSTVQFQINIRQMRVIGELLSALSLALFPMRFRSFRRQR